MPLGIEPPTGRIGSISSAMSPSMNWARVTYLTNSFAWATSSSKRSSVTFPIRSDMSDHYLARTPGPPPAVVGKSDYPVPVPGQSDPRAAT